MSNIALSDHLLSGDHVIQKECKKNAQKFDLQEMDTIIIHYTAGRNAESSVNYLCNEDVKASAHLVIGRMGEIYQLVPFDTIAWHAGKSHYGNRSGYNKYSIGIEIDNAGPLEKSGTEYISWFGGRYQSNDAILATHPNESKPRYWHTYTQAQIEACRQVCELLIKNKQYNINTILGHEEIAPKRKSDPGPAFPLDKLRNSLLFENREDEDNPVKVHGKVVNTDFLNIREEAGVEHKKIARPLTRNTGVTIVDELGGWYLVETKIKGWVSKGYIEKK